MINKLQKFVAVFSITDLAVTRRRQIMARDAIHAKEIFLSLYPQTLFYMIESAHA